MVTSEPWKEDAVDQHRLPAKKKECGRTFWRRPMSRPGMLTIWAIAPVKSKGAKASAREKCMFVGGPGGKGEGGEQRKGER